MCPPLEAAIELARLDGDESRRAAVMAELALWLARTGEYGTVADQVEEAEAVARRLGSSEILADCAIARGVAAHRQAQYSVASECFGDAERVFQHRHPKLLRTLLYHMRTAHALGDGPGLNELNQAALKLIPRLIAYQPLHDLCLAEIYVNQNDDAEAEQHLKNVIEDAEAMRSDYLKNLAKMYLDKLGSA